jgi:hypothetical protein
MSDMTTFWPPAHSIRRQGSFSSWIGALVGVGRLLLERRKQGRYRYVAAILSAAPD